MPVLVGLWALCTFLLYLGMRAQGPVGYGIITCVLVGGVLGGMAYAILDHYVSRG